MPPDLTPDMSDEDRKSRNDILARNRENAKQRTAQKQEEYNRQQTVKGATVELRKQVDDTYKLLKNGKDFFNNK